LAEIDFTIATSTNECAEIDFAIAYAGSCLDGLRSQRVLLVGLSLVSCQFRSAKYSRSRRWINR
jgi:hypothetical protein